MERKIDSLIRWMLIPVLFIAFSVNAQDVLVTPSSITINESVENNIVLEKKHEPVYIPKIDDKYILDSFSDNDGKDIHQIIIDGVPPERYRAMAVEPTMSLKAAALMNVPVFDWSFGCSATSAAMIAGYYDNNGYPDMYTGPTNGGVMQMDNLSWGTMVDDGGDIRSICPLSATMNGVDGRTTRGHVDDYWITYASTSPDPYISNGWTQHNYEDCTGDFMKTNQSVFGNIDGATLFYFYTDGSPTTYTADDASDDGLCGFKDFIESRGYSVENYFNQYIYGYNGNTLGFTFEQYQQEIDAGRPVLLQVQNHTMVGIGYDEGNLVYLHDTWDHSIHFYDLGRYIW